MIKSPLYAAAFAALLAAGCSSQDAMNQDAGSKPTPHNAMEKPNRQMQAVLSELAELNPQPIAKLSPEQARQQPTPTQAVMQLMKEKKMSTEPEPGLDVSMMNVKAEGLEVPVRVYKPTDKSDGALPVIVYIHGGGWVIATLDTYDASARALAHKTGAIVLSVDYRQAPEHKFPAAHEDSYAVLQYAINNAKEFGGDPSKVAVVGESAGGNLANAASLMANDRAGKMPVAQVLVYPITDHHFDTPSYLQYAEAKPLNRDMMMWFFDNYLSSPSDAQNKYLSPMKATRKDLSALPPTTIINAQIDPLRDDGERYADKLRQAGVDVKHKTYDGVTHEFFGMAAVVDEADDAQDLAAKRLKAAFRK